MTSFKHCWARNIFDIKPPDRVVIVHSWKQVYKPFDIEACVDLHMAIGECRDLMQVNFVCADCGIEYNQSLFGEKNRGSINE